MKFLKKIKLLALVLIVLAVGCNKDNDPVILSPEVVSTIPINDATDVGTNSTIEVKFTKEMDPASINAFTFTLFKGTTKIECALSYANSTAVFTPV